jgi:hypothetical protein
MYSADPQHRGEDDDRETNEHRNEHPLVTNVPSDASAGKLPPHCSPGAPRPEKSHVNSSAPDLAS